LQKEIIGWKSTIHFSISFKITARSDPSFGDNKMVDKAVIDGMGTIEGLKAPSGAGNVGEKRKPLPAQLKKVLVLNKLEKACLK